ncbi:sigma-54-dependent Fis family transcriptional regulator [Gimesia benthica]|uniref:Sigma-54-dependent Fis family transcriptional regulator n=1 Tax=Gimesia benthica TaxID=2608982 RepID=A0A6I6A4Z1_9PLAN|nr:sigma-54 dependent transcriptional regulator [Gimesia benthica]QGQ21477.1 sigma-54-dependent Fis family transcriptional regulator [Gimesia benthica]
MEKPLLVCTLSKRQARTALESEGCDLLVVSSAEQILSTEFPRSPRLFVMTATAENLEEVLGVISVLRNQWPLTDILIWAPGIENEQVRILFQSGVRDVCLSQSAEQLQQLVKETLENQQFLPRMHDLSPQRKKGARFESMLSRSLAMWDLFELCTRVAPTDATVLIVGETGTGKELLARAVHRRSGRSGRFVAANCASIPAELINSELFGHEKGAFTGAERAKKGLVMHANGGTLFLDEIGDMPPEAQLCLLRMLQEKRIRPVGSQSEVEIDVRIVAATNVLLDLAVREGRFREDLFYRLDVIRVNVPPLRQRPEDIFLLFGHFTKRLARHYGLEPPVFTDSFLDALLDYEWPGNVRQLENFSERLVLARFPSALTARDFARLRSTNLAETGQTLEHKQQAVWRKSIDASRTLQENLEPVIEQLEREYLRAKLKQNSGRVAETADAAGISRRTLLRKMKQYGIEKQDFKD